MVTGRIKRKQKQQKFLHQGVMYLIVLALILVFSFVWRSAHSHQSQNIGALLQQNITDIEYCNGEKLDLFVPRSSKSLSVIIYIHGGGWQYGGKSDATFDIIKPLVADNFAVASINYRLSKAAEFPAQIQDVYCAVRFLRHNADQYNINSSHIGLAGISAGAHLAALAANASKQPEFVVGPYKTESNQIQAVVSMSGVLDTESSQLGKDTSTNLDMLLAGTAYTRRSVSPSRYLSQDDPPQLVIYGTKDRTVSPKQSIQYVESARAKGVDAQLLRVQNGNHNLQSFFLFRASPNQKELTTRIADFFRQQFAAQ